VQTRCAQLKKTSAQTLSRAAWLNSSTNSVYPDCGGLSDGKSGGSVDVGATAAAAAAAGSVGGSAAMAGVVDGGGGGVLDTRMLVFSFSPSLFPCSTGEMLPSACSPSADAAAAGGVDPSSASTTASRAGWGAADAAGSGMVSDISG
jgi:hypothetical protein